DRIARAPRVVRTGSQAIPRTPEGSGRIARSVKGGGSVQVAFPPGDFTPRIARGAVPGPARGADVRLEGRLQGARGVLRGGLLVGPGLEVFKPLVQAVLLDVRQQVDRPAQTIVEAGGRKAAADVMEVVDRQAELLEVVGAAQAVGGFADLL